MRKQCTRVLAILLALLMCLSTLPAASLAAQQSAAESGSVPATEDASTPEATGSQEPYTEVVRYVTPRYADIGCEDDLPLPEAAVTAADSASYFTTLDEAAEEMRTQMEARTETINILYATDSYDSTLARAIFYAAVEHTGVPTQGDYLLRQYGGWTASISRYSSGGLYYITFSYAMSYYTTAEQEAELTAVLTELMDGMDLENQSDYEKISTIYAYICTHVTYDYANLSDEDYKLKYTAYAALINGTAVCQGYALLFYRMALEAGVDARLISGTGNGGSHAWNIVKIGKYYYNVDATWDASYYSVLGRYNYFLRCDSTFDDHTRGDDYSSVDFYAAYPMGSMDYDASAASEPGAVAISGANFPDESFRAYVSDSFDANGDGVLSAEEIACVTEIDVHDCGISDLTGIEHFSSLMSLNCDGNQLTSLDLSSNTALATLSCTGNTYTVSVDSDGCFDLSTLPGSFTTANATSWAGFTSAGSSRTVSVSGSTLTTAVSTASVCYTYDCGNGASAGFTLLVTPVVEPISDCTLTLSYTSVTYNGAAHEPSVTAVHGTTTLTQGTDYTVSYSNNVNAGTATVTVTGIGDYTGTTELSFTIGKAAQTLSAEISAASLTIGKTAQITAAAAGSISYVSSDTSIATVSSSGLVTAVAAGSATITVKAAATDNYYSTASTITITVSALATPVISSVYSTVQTSAKVTWGCVDGADGYQLYRSTEANGVYTCVKTITSGTTTRYTNVGLTIGQTYYYKVRAYVTLSDGSRIYSGFSEVRYMPAAVVFEKVYSNSTSRIRLLWSEVSGAEGYQIWRADSEDGVYKIVKTITSGETVAYSNTGLESGKTYYYKMRAYTTVDGSKVFGAYSDVYTVAVMPEAPTLAAASSSSGIAKLSWNVVSGAAGYQIWRADSANGTYTLVKSITSGSTIRYSNSGLTSGKTYYYKVRAYTEVNGNKTFGAYSEVQSVTVK